MRKPKPEHIIEIFLQPGELYFGDRNTRIRTILGSCVSLVFWHPKRLTGGMCHYMLPSRMHGSRAGLDGRYGDEAIALMLKEIHASGADPRDFRVRLFGGGNMFPGINRGRGRMLEREMSRLQGILSGLITCPSRMSMSRARGTVI